MVSGRPGQLRAAGGAAVHMWEPACGPLLQGLLRAVLSLGLPEGRARMEEALRVASRASGPAGLEPDPTRWLPRVLTCWPLECGAQRHVSAWDMRVLCWSAPRGRPAPSLW